MAKRISHGKAAADEGKKAALDAASVAFPDLGKARGIKGAIDHGERAVHHAKKAAEQAVRSKTRKAEKALRNLVNLSLPKRKRTTATKTKRKKTAAGRKR
ncbi:MAG TPA: hypothetical protein VMV84_07565 [Dehalococcoidales bacterium]|nr:hypothetical protein [Dehalococcoidales bacterium]